MEKFNPVEVLKKLETMATELGEYSRSVGRLKPIEVRELLDGVRNSVGGEDSSDWIRGVKDQAERFAGQLSSTANQLSALAQDAVIQASRTAYDCRIIEGYFSTKDVHIDVLKLEELDGREHRYHAVRVTPHHNRELLTVANPERLYQKTFLCLGPVVFQRVGERTQAVKPPVITHAAMLEATAKFIAMEARIRAEKQAAKERRDREEQERLEAEQLSRPLTQGDLKNLREQIKREFQKA
jgi:hypothetical protein